MFVSVGLVFTLGDHGHSGAGNDGGSPHGPDGEGVDRPDEVVHAPHQEVHGELPSGYPDVWRTGVDGDNPDTAGAGQVARQDVLHHVQETEEAATGQTRICQVGKMFNKLIFSSLIKTAITVQECGEEQEENPVQ